MNKNLLAFTKQVVGLYVSNDTVDLVVLKGTLKGPRLVKFGQTSIYPKKQETQAAVVEPQDGAVLLAGSASQQKTEKKTKEDYIVEAIQRVFRENNVKPGNVVTAISSEETMVRYFQMPKIPKQEWSSAINFEAKRYIPFRMEDVASDFQVIKGPSSANSMDVVFAAVKQKAIADFVSLIERAGVKPVIVEPAPFSLIRAFNAAEQISNKVNTAIVNISANSANITILRNGVPYLIRDIPLDESAPGDGSLDPVFEKLLSEIKLSFDFYEKQFPSEVIDKIIIYSQLPLENWHELVGKELQIPIEVGDPLRGVRIKKDIVPPKLAIAFGLALRGLSETFIGVNLCKERMLVYKHKEIFLKMAFLEASAARLFLIVLRVICMKMIAPLPNELDRTLSERPRVEVNIKDNSIDALERIKNEMEAKRHLMENIILSRTYFTDRLVELAELIPKDVWLTEIDFEEKLDKKDVSKVSRRLSLKGYCMINENKNETDTVNNFLIDLKQSSAVQKGMTRADIVSVKKTEIEGEGAASFEISFTGP